ncbi:MAG: hypothetical protein NTU98_06360 [Bacteroidetes bacterium]|nr:hypothetical protein [Bacteroidota bacterium]
MKKIFITILLFVIAIIAIPKVTFGAPYIYFHISIADNCKPQPYTGNYCIQVWIYHNTDVVCTWTDCNLTASSSYVDYTGCDFVQEDEQHYRIVAKMWRQNNTGCTDTELTGWLYPGQLNNYYGTEQTLNFTLQ